MNGHFLSDACAGAHPTVLDALHRANDVGAVPPGGEDPLTRRLLNRVSEVFGPVAEAILVFTGTAANVLGLAGLVRPYEAVVCAASAHINEDECGAIEQALGVKLLPVPGVDGKIGPDDVGALLGRRGVARAVQPSVVSISQPTELGTTYSRAELTELAEHCQANDLRLHVDGARLANAAVWLGCDLPAAAAGADVISLGFTKNGALGAELVIYRDGAAPPGLAHRHKQAAQVAGKMRFLAAQVEAMLVNDLWRRNAEHANAMARRLAAQLCTVTRPVQANSVFFTLPAHRREEIATEYQLLLWDEDTDELRCTCSWDTRERDVDELAEAINAKVPA